MKLKVRFPNESHYDEIEFDKLKDFESDKELDESLFGWWGDVYVEVLKIETDNGYKNPFKVTKTIKDPFVGEIELTKVGETSRHAVGETIVNTIYNDGRGSYYVDEWVTTGNDDPQPMMFLRKELIDEIIKIRENG